MWRRGGAQVGESDEVEPENLGEEGEREVQMEENSESDEEEDEIVELTQVDHPEQLVVSMQQVEELNWGPFYRNCPTFM